MGRFISPEREASPWGQRCLCPEWGITDYANPQDLNRYSYVRGNPVRFTLICKKSDKYVVQLHICPFFVPRQTVAIEMKEYPMAVRKIVLPMIIWLAMSVPLGAQVLQLGGCPVFPADNIWNTPIDQLPVDANSAAYIAAIGADGFLHPDFGTEWQGAPIGIPYVVASGVPSVPVTFDYAAESDPGPYPIPTDAPIEGGATGNGDRHVLVLDADTCKLYELYAAYPHGDGSWHTGSGAVFDLSGDALRPDGWTSADAAGLPILPGLVRYDEVQTGEIAHAIRFTAAHTRGAHVWPARHDASALTGSQYPSMGQRFRLKAGYDISGFTADVQVILRAMKTYGIILADNGSDWFISGAHDMRWNDDTLGELKSVPGAAFEAVDVSSLMVDRDSAAVNGFALQVEPAARAINPGGHTAFTVWATGVFSGSVALTVSAVPGMTSALQPTGGTLPLTATLTLTDTHSGTLQSGLVHTLTITAGGGEFTHTVAVRLWVGGWRVYLPLILK